MGKRVIGAPGLKKVGRVAVRDGVLRQANVDVAPGAAISREELDRIRLVCRDLGYHQTYALLDCIWGIAVGCGVEVVVW